MNTSRIVPLLVIAMIMAGAVGYFYADGVPTVINLESTQKASIIATEQAKCVTLVKDAASTKLSVCEANLKTSVARVKNLEDNRAAAWSGVNNNTVSISAVNKALIDMNKTISGLIVDLNKTVIKEC